MVLVLPVLEFPTREIFGLGACVSTGIPFGTVRAGRFRSKADRNL